MGVSSLTLNCTMVQKFCLQWNNFQENIGATFSDLRKDIEFTDVILACEDGQQVEAHKFILAASSPLFKSMLLKNKHVNPLIYMRGMKMDDLVAIMDFLYYGETSVYEENIDNFLALAEELKLKGLSKRSRNEPKPNEIGSDQTENNKKNKTVKKEENATADLLVPSNDQHVSAIPQEAEAEKESEGNIALPSYTFTGEMHELDAKIKSMMIPSENFVQNGKSSKARAHTCTVCGKEGLGKNIKDHIEAYHVEGVSLPCGFCDRTFRSRSALRHHNRNNHTVA